ncbi:uncharacterized protein LOC131330023 isoform X2 [Rhododendron vialii]|uniref:uncharacterized protein LOC131330023 isoform X2 n=1 Tax=Rhododendron vialii TaxID=182163 RepID=UPI00265F5F0C|nr:uncharacterized protein LOC131330023 isoform X2 [Rhododendron vialii]
MSTIENNLDFRCTLEIHVGGKLVRGAQVEYLGGFVAQSKECEVAVETTVIGGHEIEVPEETRANSGRGGGRGGRGSRGKIARGGKSARGGKTTRGSGAMVVGGTGRGGDPASKHGTIAPRGKGRGRGGTSAPLHGVMIRETNPNTRTHVGRDKGVNCGKGKQPIVYRGKSPTTRFGGAPMVGLPPPQGWRRSTRMGNALFWTQPETTSSAASCGSGGGSGSATMPTTQPSSSTPSTQKSAT